MSTRLVSLQRIALALLLWAQFAAPLRPVHQLSQTGTVLGTLPSLLFWCISPLMLVGCFSRTASALAGGLALWHWSRQASFALGHDAAGLLCWSALWLSLAPCGGSFSFDRWRAVRAARRQALPPPPERGEGEGLWLLRLHLTAMLVLRALDRSRLSWLSGEALGEQARALRLDGPVPGGLATALETGLGPVVALLTFAVGWMLPVALWLPATRGAAVTLTCLGWLMVYPILPLGIESLLVCVLACSFLDPELVHGALDRLLGRAEASGPKP